VRKKDQGREYDSDQAEIVSHGMVWLALSGHCNVYDWAPVSRREPIFHHYGGFTFPKGHLATWVHCCMTRAQPGFGGLGESRRIRDTSDARYNIYWSNLHEQAQSSVANADRLEPQMKRMR